MTTVREWELWYRASDGAPQAIRWILAQRATGDVAAMDEMLGSVDPKLLSRTAVASVLTYTWAWSAELRNRTQLLDRCADLFSDCDPQWRDFIARMRRCPPGAILSL